MEDNKKDKKMDMEQAEENVTQVLPQAVEAPDADEDGGSEEEKKGIAVFGRTFSKKQVCMAGIGLLCAAIVVGGGVWAYGNANGGNGTDSEPVTASQPASESDDEETSYVLDLGVKADGWDSDTSSPVIAHIQSEDGGTDFYHAYDANEDATLAVDSEGTYKVTFISPVNADGSIYKVGSESKVEAVAKEKRGSDSGKSDATSLPFTFEKVDADKVTKDELTNLAKDVAEAVKKGDKTLTGETGASVVSKVEENIKKNPNADTEAVEKETEAAQETAKKEESTAKTPETSSGKSDSGSNTSTSKKDTSGSSQTSSSSNGGSSSKTESKGNTSGNSGSSSKKEESTHQHNWVAQTKTVHHDAQYKTVHHDAVTHQVWHDAEIEVRHICNNCGADITGQERSHMESSLLNGGNCGSYHSEYNTIKEGYYETITDQAAYDEQVQASAAWDETVTTGYVCSSCGATK